jgi:hypothetical protein
MAFLQRSAGFGFVEHECLFELRRFSRTVRRRSNRMDGPGILDLRGLRAV